ncbi:gastrula zinc finger protein XlCGF46.1-like [Hyposmocoma kahamanoa]|uniref:gastrula zinc finger protein XlCGF46.1-like n=1 Tax=Hyposmocoma kahamanoa TaxID=1477025 RepID=UPI000E6D676D|nr:gastrula zinc finger protein XlCGF46.1-like [Hyposmocoma kahamanoa]
MTQSQFQPVCYVDADYGNNLVDRRSYTGFVFLLNGTPISWEARKQRTVALSTTEAEYMALAEACKEAIYLKSLYCHFCNEQFPTPEACTIHSYNHWFENKTCDRCGEQLPDAESLMRHKGQFKKSLYPRKYVRRTAHFVAKDDTSTWDSYKCICQVCHLYTEDIATLRKHAEEVHVKCFVNKCFDCLYVPRDYKSFVNHVLQHRPWLKIPCPYCSVPFTRDNPPRKHLRQHETEHEKLCNKCGQMFQGNQFKEHVQKFNVQGHKLRLTCDVCFKEFNAKSNLRDHKAVKHGHIDHAHICEICGQSYKVKARLRQHMNTHLRKRNVCQYCQLCFPSPYALKKHVKTHLNLQDQYICDYCGICIKSKSHLRRHMTCHTSNKEMYKCQYCDKTFSQKEYRKTHEYLHTGKKTFQCQKCPLSFTNWGNCNKHMIRRHGITIAKTRRTTAGRLRVNETGDVVEVKDNVRKWLNDVASQAPCTKRK